MDYEGMDDNQLRTTCGDDPAKWADAFGQRAGGQLIRESDMHGWFATVIESAELARALRRVEGFGEAFDLVVKGAPPPIKHLLRFFRYSHLPKHLQAVSRPFAELAMDIATGPENPETSAALRKLVEAKDCAVRALLPPEPT